MGKFKMNITHVCIIAVALVLAIMFLDSHLEKKNVETPTFLMSDLAEVPGYENYLVYSTENHTVYYFMYHYGKGFMSPYIVNGHTCEYVNGEIVEVIPTIRIEDITH